MNVHRNYRHMIQCLLAAAICLLAGSPAINASDWRQFRGNDANSVSSETLPTELSGDCMAWKVSLPGRGVSGPIVIGNKLFLTASSGYAQDRLHVLCFDSANGKKLWERQFDALGRTICHDKMSIATPTMAGNDKYVYAFYSSNDLICLDHDGNMQWFRALGSEFPNASNSLGMSSSPILIGETVIVQVESDAEAFACGVDGESGETKWQIERPRAANWTSPTLIRGEGGRPSLALLQSSKGLTAVDPETGTIVWNFDKGASTIPSATVSDGTVVIPSNGLTALKPNADGTGFTEAWNASNLSPATSSPVVVNGMALTLNSAGALSAANAENGERIWQLRLKGPFSGTPVAANGHLYVISEGGTVFVVRPESDKGTIVSELDITEDMILCSPAAADGGLFVRSDSTLWKFARP